MLRGLQQVLSIVYGEQLAAGGAAEKERAAPAAAAVPVMRTVAIEHKEPARAAEQPAIPRLDGIDTDAGLKRTRGNRDLYVSLLKQFVMGFAAFGEELTLLLREGKLDDAQRLAHSLKGVAANVGAGRSPTPWPGAGAAPCEASRFLPRTVERELRPLIAKLAAVLALPPMTPPPLAAVSGPNLWIDAAAWVADLRRS